MDEVARKGRSIRRPSFTIYYAPTPKPPRPRIVISQKVDKRSTVRNRLRRQIREILRGIAIVNLALVVIVKKEAVILEFAALRDQLKSALAKL